MQLRNVDESFRRAAVLDITEIAASNCARDAVAQLSMMRRDSSLIVRRAVMNALSKISQEHNMPLSA